MTLSQLAAEAAARLKDLRDMQGPTADADCFISWPISPKGTCEERSVQGVELFQGVLGSRSWYFEIKTQKDEE